MERYTFVNPFMGLKDSGVFAYFPTNRTSVTSENLLIRFMINYKWLLVRDASVLFLNCTNVVTTIVGTSCCGLFCAYSVSVLFSIRVCRNGSCNTVIVLFCTGWIIWLGLWTLRLRSACDFSVQEYCLSTAFICLWLLAGVWRRFLWWLTYEAVEKAFPHMSQVYRTFVCILKWRLSFHAAVNVRPHVKQTGIDNTLPVRSWAFRAILWVFSWVRSSSRDVHGCVHVAQLYGCANNVSQGLLNDTVLWIFSWFLRTLEFLNIFPQTEQVWCLRNFE